MLEIDDANWRRPIPIFPLPNCVLFPGAVLPLHIFEPRYVEMLEAVAARSSRERLLAMALLREGWEPYYHTRHAPIHRVVCVGRVIQHEELPDGRFNLLLLGLRRATILVETGEAEYRQALLSPVESDPEASDEDRLRDLLHRTIAALGKHTGALSPGALSPDAIERIFDSAPSTDLLVDVLAYHLVSADQTGFKQSLLEEHCAKVRAERLMRHLCAALTNDIADPPAKWPPPTSPN